MEEAPENGKESSLLHTPMELTKLFPHSLKADAGAVCQISRRSP
jgi:hypothetical protein